MFFLLNTKPLRFVTAGMIKFFTFSIRKNKCRAFSLTPLLLTLCGVLLLVAPAFASNVENIGKICPDYASRREYRDVVKEMSFRINDSVKEFGCGVLPVYYAFGQDDSYPILASFETNSELMRVMVDALDARPDLAEALRNTPKLASALSTHFNNPEALANYITALQNYDRQTFKNLSQIKDTKLLLACILIPGASPQYLSRRFSAKELDLLVRMLEVSALTSDETYMPFLAERPNDTCDIYKDLIQEWGAGDLEKFLKNTPYVFSSIRPPMTRGEIDWLFSAGSLPSPESFRTMQRCYIRMQHVLYQKMSRRYGNPAWAAEYCASLVEPLAASLLGASAAQEENIRRFLSWLTCESLFFKNIVLPSKCFPVSNLNKFGTIFSLITGAPLRDMAEWYVEGQLVGFLDAWTNTTSARNFVTTEEGSKLWQYDIKYLESMARLAEKRTQLSSKHKILLDYLLTTLPAPEDNPYQPAGFLLSIFDTLFPLLQDKNFSNETAVAEHLLKAGYPNDGDPSLYDDFCVGNPPDRPDALTALNERGRLPEAELLRSGMTLRANIRRSVGVDPVVAGIKSLQVVDFASDVIDVVSLVATCTGIGAAAGGGLKVLSLSLKAGTKAGIKVLKNASRQMIRQGAKGLARGMPKGMSFAQARKALRGYLPESGQALSATAHALKVPKISVSNMGKAAFTVDALYNLRDDLYDLLKEDEKDEFDWSEVKMLCPGKTETSNNQEEPCS